MHVEERITQIGHSNLQSLVSSVGVIGHRNKTTAGKLCLPVYGYMCTRIFPAVCILHNTWNAWTNMVTILGLLDGPINCLCTCCLVDVLRGKTCCMLKARCWFLGLTLGTFLHSLFLQHANFHLLIDFLFVAYVALSMVGVEILCFWSCFLAGLGQLSTV